MKKIIYIGVLIFIGFMAPTVKAEVIFKCNYLANFSEIVTNAKNTKVKIEVFVNDDGTATFPDFTSSINGTELLGGNNIGLAGYTKKTYYEYATKSGNTCPDINFSWEGNTINLTVGSFVEQDSSMSVSGEIAIVKDGTEKAIRKDTCIRSRNLRNDKIGIYITFFTIGDVRWWSVKGYYNTTGTATDTVDKSISLGDKTFTLEKAVIEKVFNSTKDCNETKIYLRTPPQSNLNTVTTTKPDDSENGSYGVDDAWKDTGSDMVENERTSKWNFTDGKTLEFAKKIYSIIRIVIPVLIIVLSIVDFLKVLLLSDDKNYKASFNKFIKRIVIGIIFFLVPVLISLILNLSGLGDSGILNVFK